MLKLIGELIEAGLKKKAICTDSLFTIYIVLLSLILYVCD